MKPVNATTITKNARQSANSTTTPWTFSLDTNALVRVAKAWRDSNATVNSLTNNMRNDLFVSLIGALRRLDSLPSDDDFAISKETSRTAEKVLTDIAERTAEVPKLMPMEGEALVLTWVRGDVKRYLKIDGEDIHLLDFKRSNGMRCEADWDLIDEEAYRQWLNVIAGKPSSYTSQNLDS